MNSWLCLARGCGLGWRAGAWVGHPLGEGWIAAAGAEERWIPLAVGGASPSLQVVGWVEQSFPGSGAPELVLEIVGGTASLVLQRWKARH